MTAEERKVLTDIFRRLEKLEEIIKRQMENTRPSNYELDEMIKWEKVYKRGI